MPMNRERRLHIARVVSLIASTAISLSAGTNYVYSAYAPQLASKLNLSATESNLIGTFGNLGMYLSGIPSGMLVDGKGPRPPLLIGAVALFLGYYPMYLAMERGEGSMSVAALCFFSTLTGVGSCCSFGGALKMAALNWPTHRGTATAIPLAAFGLSAFFFSSLSSWAFPGNTEDFLLVLSFATSGIILVSFFFCRAVPVSTAALYDPLSGNDAENNRLHRTKSVESRRSSLRFDEELGTNSKAGSSSPVVVPNTDPTSDENSSLFSRSSESDDGRSVARSARNLIGDDAHTDIRGLQLIKSVDFWLLFTMLGTLCGVGLMTINNIGHDSQALWLAYDPSKSLEFLQKRQGMHVSILSICSFAGRITSGISSDIFAKRYNTQRLWLIIASATLFLLGQFAALNISNPNNLWLVSSLNGLGYGVLFGVCPTIVSEAFGIHGLSTNWGTMTIAAVISGNILNLFYGHVFDTHSDVIDGRRECSLGLECYRNAYWISTCFVLLGAGVTIVGILRNRKRRSSSLP